MFGKWGALNVSNSSLVSITVLKITVAISKALESTKFMVPLYSLYTLKGISGFFCLDLQFLQQKPATLTWASSFTESSTSTQTANTELHISPLFFLPLPPCSEISISKLRLWNSAVTITGKFQLLKSESTGFCNLSGEKELALCIWMGKEGSMSRPKCAFPFCHFLWRCTCFVLVKTL